jgi:glycosyltransferase involved in cell wall biosynthesis
VVNTSDDILVESFCAAPASLRIAVVTETYAPEVNGVAMTLGRIVEGLIRRGHTVELVRPRQPLEGAPVLRDGLHQVLSRGVPLPSYGELRFGMPAKRRLSKLWSARRPDVVHVVTEGPLGWSAVAAARTLQLPTTSSFHTNFDSYSQHYGIGLLKSPIDTYLRKLHNRTLATMVPTEALVQTLQARGYKHVTLLSRGVDTALFQPAKRSQALRQSWGAQANDPVVVLVGRLAKEKNVGQVLAAFAALRQHRPSARLVLVGDGPLRASLQQACPDAHFAGVRKGEDLAAHYASADLFLFASLTETYGNVVPEALASGLAVLSYAHAAAGELISNGHNGLVVEAADSVAYLQAAITLATAPELVARLRAAAPASVAHLGWDAIVDRFVATLHGAMDRHAQALAAPLQQSLPHADARARG